MHFFRLSRRGHGAPVDFNFTLSCKSLTFRLSRASKKKKNFFRKLTVCRDELVFIYLFVIFSEFAFLAVGLCIRARAIFLVRSNTTFCMFHSRWHNNNAWILYATFFVRLWCASVLQLQILSLKLFFIYYCILIRSRLDFLMEKYLIFYKNKFLLVTHRLFMCLIT